MLFQQVLNADGMQLPVYIRGNSFIGIGVTGTWVGTVKFKASEDGINFIDLGMTPFASGTAVTSTTANGNWFSPVLNFQVFRAEFTRTSGSVGLIVGTSVDAAYQDAFLTSSTIFPKSTATGAVNTLTQSSQANRAWTLLSLKIDASSTPSWLTLPHVKINDGSTTLWQFNLPTVGSSGQLWDVTLPTGGITNTAGSAMSIVLANPQGSVITNINAQFKSA